MDRRKIWDRSMSVSTHILVFWFRGLWACVLISRAQLMWHCKGRGPGAGISEPDEHRWGGTLIPSTWRPRIPAYAQCSITPKSSEGCYLLAERDEKSESENIGFGPRLGKMATGISLLSESVSICFRWLIKISTFPPWHIVLHIDTSSFFCSPKFSEEGNGGGVSNTPSPFLCSRKTLLLLSESSSPHTPVLSHVCADEYPASSHSKIHLNLQYALFLFCVTILFTRAVKQKECSPPRPHPSPGKLTSHG